MTSYCIRRVGTEIYCGWQDSMLFWTIEKHRHTFMARQHAIDHIAYLESIRPHLKSQLEVIEAND